MDKSLLRKLRFFEGVIMNITFLSTLLLFFVMPIYLGISFRLTASFALSLLLCSKIIGQRLYRLLYVRIFTFMKPLWDYEQQKLISDKWIKWRRNGRYFNYILMFVLIIIIIFPPPMPRRFNWEMIKYSLSGSLIGYNIGMVWKILTEKFYY